MSHYRGKRAAKAQALRRNPEAWSGEPITYRFDLDENKPWPLPKSAPLDMFGNERPRIDRDAIKTPFDD